ncbi:hypothetical protein DSO57_1014157 [Entomophthora muscae]|uniref:Uncharacterized protein n=1 Tax=Entomophthora muscae TaxID=34485 RepID=A0ACC2RWR5_9FUNG|nr:hypothetical protein DSO57_1014157 [Entomophthora muscae]
MLSEDVLVWFGKATTKDVEPQKKPYVDQGRQEPAQLPVGLTPGPPEMPCPNQEEQESASLPSVKTGSSISTLETPELNPNPPKAI